jgi:sterol desaturase/sphingolipid hydroxylase (fatty acid hydroxylase superfamily)
LFDIKQYMSAYLPLLIVVGLAVLMIAWEAIRPAARLPAVRGWWARAVLANLIQLGIVILAGFTWNVWLRGHSLVSAANWPDAIAAAVTYFLSTFIFYWWHRIRHESEFWWRLAHQIHHSATRLQIFTAFYKHPLEIALDSVLCAIIVYPLMGCSPFQGAIYTVLTAAGEFFYHWNVHTPRWIGAVFQRPESHRIHHQRDRHTRNYADIPLWDFLFGTYSNPTNADKVACGFSNERERQFSAMLLGKPVDVKRDSEPLDFRPACFGCRKKHLCERRS